MIEYDRSDFLLRARIKGLLYERGMKIDAAREVLLVSYRKYAPRNPYVCKSKEDAVNLLTHVAKMFPDEPHAIERIKAVVEWNEDKEPES